MLNIPWKVRGICLGAPMPDEIDLFEEFVEKKLAPGGCNLIIMLIRWRFRSRKQPESVSPNGPLDGATKIKQIVDICKKHNIRLIPKLNLMGHQSGKTADSLDGLLHGHPYFDETPDKKEVFYCRSLCPRHPQITDVVFTYMDEVVTSFQSDAVHIGMDEVFEIGKCPRCKDTPTYKLFADWTNTLVDHNRERGTQTYMWGDRLLNSLETGYGGWEASANFTEPALDLIRKRIILCDWHYEDRPSYPSVEIFADAGFRMMVCPWRYKANAEKFINYAKENDKGHILGLLATTWIGSGHIMRYMLNGTEGDENQMKTLAPLAETLDWIFATQ